MQTLQNLRNIVAMICYCEKKINKHYLNATHFIDSLQFWIVNDNNFHD
jgi:hypothetical protein